MIFKFWYFLYFPHRFCSFKIVYASLLYLSFSLLPGQLLLMKTKLINDLFIKQINFKLTLTTNVTHELQILTHLDLCGSIAQFVKHCTDNAEVMSSNPAGLTWIFQVPIKKNNCLNCPGKCEDHFFITSKNNSVNRYLWSVSLYSLSKKQWAHCFNIN